MTVEIEELIAAFPKRRADAHKGDCGHVFVLAGSSGYTGAAYLTSQAAMRAGSGLVTLAVGKSLYPILAAKLTEVMVRPFFETKDLSLSVFGEKELLSFAERCTVVAIGPGLSQNKETQTLVRNIVAKVNRPIVLDADGINAFAGQAALLKDVRMPIVLTPHPGEFSRLSGIAPEAIGENRKDVALAFAREYNTVIVLKGAHTIVADPKGSVYSNGTGNSGMATAGAGDLLTGIIASFIGQGIDAFAAAALGVHYHGLAGDLACREKGVLSLIASDLLQALPDALKTLA